MKQELIDNNPVLKHTFNFSLAVIHYCELLQNEKRFILSNQLLKSATSIGANAMEAQNAESKADFIHKIKIAAKEADETDYWLTLTHYSKSYPDCSLIMAKLTEIQKILNKIISTAKTRTQL